MTSKRLLLAGLGAAALGAALLRWLGFSPRAAYAALLEGALGSPLALGLTLVKATPLLLIALATVLCFRARIYNIGGEGQMLAGCLATCFLGLHLGGLPSPLGLPLVLLGAALAGAVFAAIPGLLKARLGVNEVLSTVMFNQVALHLTIYLLRGPLQDPAQVASGVHLPETAALPAGLWLGRPFPPTAVHNGLWLALALAVAVWFALLRTTWGFRLRLLGHNPEAARYCGVRVERSIVGIMAAAGALAGLAGALEVLGVHHRGLEGMSAGYGFSGIVAALAGGLHPLAAVPAALGFGSLLAGSEQMQRQLQIPAALALVFQGLVVLFLTPPTARAESEAGDDSG